MRSEVLQSGGDPVETGETMLLRLGGSSSEVALYESTLEVRSPSSAPDAPPISWRSVVAMLDPWPHQGTAVMFGQSGFLEACSVTFRPDGFVVEPAGVFRVPSHRPGTRPGDPTSDETRSGEADLPARGIDRHFAAMGDGTRLATNGGCQPPRDAWPRRAMNAAKRETRLPGASAARP